jgi:hypothetical protein
MEALTAVPAQLLLQVLVRVLMVAVVVKVGVAVVWW